MSCPHGNHPDICDICAEIDAAYESGKKDAIAELAGVEMPEPVVWQSRFFESHPQTVNYGTWSEWELVTPRNIHTDTVADRVREFQSYITQGYKYELRALVTLDQLREAVAAAVAKAVAAERERIVNCYSPDDTIADYQDKIRGGQ